MSKKNNDFNWNDEGEKTRVTDSVKDLVMGLLKTAPKLKEELGKRLSDEIMKLVSKIDLATEAKKFLETHKVTVKAEFEFKKRDDV